MVVPVFCMVMDAWNVAPGATVDGTFCIWNAAPLTPGSPLLELAALVALLLETPGMLADELPPTDEVVPPELVPTDPALEDTGEPLLLDAVPEDEDAEDETTDPDDEDDDEEEDADDDDVEEVLSPAAVPHPADNVNATNPQVQ